MGLRTEDRTTTSCGVFVRISLAPLINIFVAGMCTTGEEGREIGVAWGLNTTRPPHVRALYRCWSRYGGTRQVSEIVPFLCSVVVKWYSEVLSLCLCTKHPLMFTPKFYFVPRIINSTSNLITMNNSKTMHTSSYSIAQILNDTVPLFIQ